MSIATGQMCTCPGPAAAAEPVEDLLARSNLIPMPYRSITAVSQGHLIPVPAFSTSCAHTTALLAARCSCHGSARFQAQHILPVTVLLLMLL